MVSTARASLEELLLDDEDFLRHRHLEQWVLDTEQAFGVRRVPRTFTQNHEGPFDPPEPADHIPDCPLCGSTMIPRTAKAGKNVGKQFWGCSAYPHCRGVVWL